MKISGADDESVKIKQSLPVTVLSAYKFLNLLWFGHPTVFVMLVSLLTQSLVWCFKGRKGVKHAHRQTNFSVIITLRRITL